MSVRVRAAHEADYAEVLMLLRQAKLPTDGVQEHFRNFIVAHDDEESLIGCVGLERHGEVTLLRSLVVGESSRGKGLGRELVLEAMSLARALKVREIVLLTTTAAKFFEGFFGFEAIPRSDYDAVLSASPEWHLTQCASATCMRLPLA